MKLIKLLFLSFITSYNCLAQDTEEPPEEGWSSEGKFQVLFNQSAFNAEWSGGGTSSVAANVLLDYNLHYLEDDQTWDTRFLVNYGLTKLKGDEFLRKTSDRLEINSIAGNRLKESNWYYSVFLNFRTQFSKGYEYVELEDQPDTRVEKSHFLSPAYLQGGPGIMWKKSENLWINFAPATARLIFVDDYFTTLPGYQDGSYYGLGIGKSMRFELGASLTGYSQTEIVENVSMENSLSLYSNYLNDPGNIDIDYLMNLNLAVNKYLSANLIFQAIYDDNTVGAFQIREVFGAGLNYSF